MEYPTHGIDVQVPPQSQEKLQSQAIKMMKFDTYESFALLPYWRFSSIFQPVDAIRFVFSNKPSKRVMEMSYVARFCRTLPEGECHIRSVEFEFGAGWLQGEMEILASILDYIQRTGCEELIVFSCAWETFSHPEHLEMWRFLNNPQHPLRKLAIFSPIFFTNPSLAWLVKTLIYASSLTSLALSNRDCPLAQWRGILSAFDLPSLTLLYINGASVDIVIEFLERHDTIEEVILGPYVRGDSDSQTTALLRLSNLIKLGGGVDAVDGFLRATDLQFLHEDLIISIDWIGCLDICCDQLVDNAPSFNSQKYLSAFTHISSSNKTFRALRLEIPRLSSFSKPFFDGEELAARPERAMLVSMVALHIRTEIEDEYRLIAVRVFCWQTDSR